MLRMENFPEVYIKLRPDEFALTKDRAKSPGSLRLATKLFTQERYDQALPLLIYHAKRGKAELSICCT